MNDDAFDALAIVLRSDHGNTQAFAPGALSQMFDLAFAAVEVSIATLSFQYQARKVTETVEDETRDLARETTLVISIPVVPGPGVRRMLGVLGNAVAGR